MRKKTRMETDKPFRATINLHNGVTVGPSKFRTEQEALLWGRTYDGPLTRGSLERTIQIEEQQEVISKRWKKIRTSKQYA